MKDLAFSLSRVYDAQINLGVKPTDTIRTVFEDFL